MEPLFGVQRLTQDLSERNEWNTPREQGERVERPRPRITSGSNDDAIPRARPVSTQGDTLDLMQVIKRIAVKYNQKLAVRLSRTIP